MMQWPAWTPLVCLVLIHSVAAENATEAGLWQGPCARIVSCPACRLNALPSVKKFLKERNGADLYPMVEVIWQRGHDPEMEIHSCDGQPPSSRVEAGLSPSARIALSPFSTQDLHFLLQCQGIQPAPASQAPKAASKADACERLPVVSAWDWQFVGAGILISAVFVVPIWILCRLAQNSGPLLRHRLGPKAKLDDEEAAISGEQPQAAV